MKVPYQPSENKRFEVSKDPISRERIKKVLEVYKELNGNLPELGIAFSLFGSLSKGKKLNLETQEFTDIDLYVFLKSEIFQNEVYFSELRKKIPEFDIIFQAKEKEISTLHTGIFSKADVIFLAFQKFLENYIENRTGLKNTFHFTITRLSADPTSEFSILKQFQKDDEEGYKISKLFGLDVGGGLKKFRRDLLLQIRELPEDYRRITWSRIKYEIEAYERRRIVPEEIKRLYPDTFEDACKYYGVK